MRAQAFGFGAVDDVIVSAEPDDPLDVEGTAHDVAQELIYVLVVTVLDAHALIGVEPGVFP